MIISVIGRAEKRETERVHDFGGVLADFFRGFSGLATFFWAFFCIFYHSVLCVFLASAKTAAILVVWFDRGMVVIGKKKGSPNFGPRTVSRFGSGKKRRAREK